jgi:acyl-CoA hydrolase
VSEQADPGDGLHRLSMTVLMTPDMSNFSGNVHGGLLLKLLDQVAYTCASRYARAYAVALSVDQVVFREPVHVGELVTFAASVNYTGRTSMEIGIRVTTEDLVAREVRHTNSCYFTMVALGPDGRPVPVPGPDRSARSRGPQASTSRGSAEVLSAGSMMAPPCRTRLRQWTTAPTTSVRRMNSRALHCSHQVPPVRS